MHLSNDFDPKKSRNRIVPSSPSMTAISQSADFFLPFCLISRIRTDGNYSAIAIASLPAHLPQAGSKSAGHRRKVSPTDGSARPPGEGRSVLPPPPRGSSSPNESEPASQPTIPPPRPNNRDCSGRKYRRRASSKTFVPRSRDRPHRFAPDGLGSKAVRRRPEGGLKAARRRQ